jgi:hypothetical protein
VRERSASSRAITHLKEYQRAEVGGAQMKAARVLRFGPPNVTVNDNLARPEPGAEQLLVRVKAAGVGNWDALVREGKVELQPLPLILGSELSGIIQGLLAYGPRATCGAERVVLVQLLSTLGPASRQARPWVRGVGASV